MPIIELEKQRYHLESGESVLDTLLRNKVGIAHTCKSGVCRRCVVEAIEGDIPPFAQRTLSKQHRDNNLFMACVCRPVDDMVIAVPKSGSYVKATDYRAGVDNAAASLSNSNYSNSNSNDNGNSNSNSSSSSSNKNKNNDSS